MNQNKDHKAELTHWFLFFNKLSPHKLTKAKCGWGCKISLIQVDYVFNQLGRVLTIPLSQHSQFKCLPSKRQTIKTEQHKNFEREKQLTKIAWLTIVLNFKFQIFPHWMFRKNGRVHSIFFILLGISWSTRNNNAIKSLFIHQKCFKMKIMFVCFRYLYFVWRMLTSQRASFHGKQNYQFLYLFRKFLNWKVKIGTQKFRNITINDNE